MRCSCEQMGDDEVNFGYLMGDVNGDAIEVIEPGVELLVVGAQRDKSTLECCGCRVVDTIGCPERTERIKVPGAPHGIDEGPDDLFVVGRHDSQITSRSAVALAGYCRARRPPCLVVTGTAGGG